MVPTKKDSAKQPVIQQAGAPRQVAASATREDSSVEKGSAPYVVTLPLQPARPAPRVARAVPDVRGLDLRDAVRSLHSAGFRVQLARAGRTTRDAAPPRVSSRRRGH